MAIYAVNCNGDWWEIVEGVSDELMILDTDNPEIMKIMKEEDVSDGDDKFEYFIEQYGIPLDIGQSIDKIISKGDK